MRRNWVIVSAFCLLPFAFLSAQQGTLTPAEQQRRKDLEAKLHDIAVVERRVMIPMKDGVRLATDIYRPKNAAGKVPAVFVKTPYNFNFWDVRNGVPADMSRIIEAVEKGYAYVGQNERGHFFSEGNYDILGAPITDGYETIDYLTKQPWSNGKLGTTGCSSTAEWQPAVASLGHPGFAAMNVQGFGAGVGKVGPYWEQGNWYRGGAMQMLFITWIYSEQNQVRPMFPKDTAREDLIAASRMFDLAPRMPPVDWDKALWHLPTQDIIKNVNGPRGIFADRMPVETGGMMQQREPASDAWRKGGLWHDDMALNVPGLWFMSWYDVSVGPNLEMFNHVRRTAKAPVKDQQWVVIAPVAHCAFTRASEHTIVGERDMGDARLDYNDIVYGFFDKFLKGDPSTSLGAGANRIEKQARVTYYTMGSNKWQTSDVWPPAGAQPMTLHLSSGGRANSLSGDGQLTVSPPDADTPDVFTYDPMNPVTSYGGNVCCTGNAITAGSFDQRKMESRHDILVYTSEPFKDGIEVTGPIAPTLYVSSDAKDTDFTVKVLDVYPDGRAYNLDESIQRMRYRDGYDKKVWMEKDKVYRVTLQPLNTSNYFAPGHRLRIEVSSSNFPRFDRNLNTGGNNFDEAKGVVARNTVHHSKQYPVQHHDQRGQAINGNSEDSMTNDRREFMAAGLTLLAATLSERLAAEGGEPRVEGLIGAQQQAPANPSRAVATKDTPKVNLDGWQMTATEITIPPGAPPGRKHRHPGFVIGYVLDGQYSFAVNDQPAQVVGAGQMFFESFDAPGDVHSTSGNASATQPVKFLAIVFTKKGDPITIPG